MKSTPIARVINMVMREARWTGSSERVCGDASTASIRPHHRRRIGVKLHESTNNANSSTNRGTSRLEPAHHVEGNE